MKTKMIWQVTLNSKTFEGMKLQYLFEHRPSHEDIIQQMEDNLNLYSEITYEDQGDSIVAQILSQVRLYPMEPGEFYRHWIAFKDGSIHPSVVPSDRSGSTTYRKIPVVVNEECAK